MSNKPYRVLVTGSRDWDDPQAIWRALAAAHMRAVRLGHRKVIIVHGNSGQADMIGKLYGQITAGCEEEGHDPDWGAYGRGGGPLRNKEMVSLGADECIAAIGPCRERRCGQRKPHGSHGASGCAGLAERAGIPVERITPARVPVESLLGADPGWCGGQSVDAIAAEFRGLGAETGRKMTSLVLGAVQPLLVADEWEKVAVLADTKRAVYCKACDGAPCDYTDELTPFADLIRSGTQEAEPSSP